MYKRLKIALIIAALVYAISGCSNNNNQIESLKKENADLRLSLLNEQNNHDEFEKKLSSLTSQVEFLQESNKQLQESNNQLIGQLSLEKNNYRTVVAESEKKKIQNNNTLKDQIVIKLQRVVDEDAAFYNLAIRGGVRKSEFDAEETRLKSICREQESSARSITSDLKGQGYMYADSLDRLIKEFAFNYCTSVSYLNMQYYNMAKLGQDYNVATLGHVVIDIKENLEKFTKAYLQNFSDINLLKGD
jgi:hypothetical protein